MVRGSKVMANGKIIRCFHVGAGVSEKAEGGKDVRRGSIDRQA